MAAWLDHLLKQQGGPLAVESHRIGWSPSSWEEVGKLDRRFKAAIAGLADTAQTSILRSDVREVGRRHGDIGSFIAAMIWGFGPTGYGPRRLTDMLTTHRGANEPADVAAEIMATARRDGAVAGFGALWSGGRTRVFKLGTAFGTKALYFAADATTPGETPLVLDQFVHAGAAKINERFHDACDVPDPGRYMTRADYGNYCAWAAACGASSGTTPDGVEYALFALGQGRIDPPEPR
jgi:hypothetical protein